MVSEVNIRQYIQRWVRETPQRRYEVLRAFFVEHRLQANLAAQFGLTLATVQSLVRDFRAHMRDGHVSPFLSSPTSAGLSALP